MLEKEKHRGWHSRGYLPHFDEPNLIQMITFRLVDSLPAEAMIQIEADFRGKPESEKRKLIEAYLDQSNGSCYLRDPRIATVVEETLLNFDGERYKLIAWVVMPNHVHTVIEIVEGFSLEKIVYS